MTVRHFVTTIRFCPLAWLADIYWTPQMWITMALAQYQMCAGFGQHRRGGHQKAQPFTTGSAGRVRPPGQQQLRASSRHISAHAQG